MQPPEASKSDVPPKVRFNPFHAPFDTAANPPDSADKNPIVMQEFVQERVPVDQYSQHARDFRFRNSEPTDKVSKVGQEKEQHPRLRVNWPDTTDSASVSKTRLSPPAFEPLSPTFGNPVTPTTPQHRIPVGSGWIEYGYHHDPTRSASASATANDHLGDSGESGRVYHHTPAGLVSSPATADHHHQELDEMNRDLRDMKLEQESKQQESMTIFWLHEYLEEKQLLTPLERRSLACVLKQEKNAKVQLDWWRSHIDEEIRQLRNKGCSGVEVRETPKWKQFETLVRAHRRMTVGLARRKRELDEIMTTRVRAKKQFGMVIKNEDWKRTQPGVSMSCERIGVENDVKCGGEEWEGEEQEDWEEEEWHVIDGDDYSSGLETVRPKRGWFPW